MSASLPGRPSRRAAAKRNIVVDELDEDDVPNSTKMEDDEDDFTPAAIQSPKRTTRRRATEMPQTPRSAARTRRTKTGDGIAPVEAFEAEADDQQLVSPTKQGSPRKRKGAAPARRGRPPATKRGSTQLPTPQASRTPEPADDSKLPLSDITNAVNNEPLPATATNGKPVILKPTETTLEKPMDIVIRSRAIATPNVEEDTAPKPRAVIKSLILMNFKSYAGRQEVGPFHASFSSVVGPNGSGKSNVIDSLLFVFGFRASKMRQGKISALIHNSAAFPDLDYCEVEVHFQEVMDLQGGGHEVLPGSDLIISRKAFKSNASKYYINARESNFTDVTTLLKGKGVDLDHKRFLILQGEVESIAQMKPKAATEHDDGLLEYLEDIIGTSKYKTPIEESAAEVDTFNEICLEKSARVQHVEKEKNGLEDKKNKALDFIKNENELAAKQSALYQVYTVECEDNLKVTDEAIAQTSAELDAELERHRGNEDGISSLQKAHKRGLKELEALQKATQAVLKEMAKFDKENVKHEEKKKFLKSKKSKQEKSLQTTRLAASEARSLVDKHTDDLTRHTREITSLEEEMTNESQELSTIREGLKGKTQGFSDQITAKQKKLEPWTEKINAKKSAIALVQSELDMLRERASSGTVAIEEMQARLQSLEAELKSKQAELKHLESSRSRISKDAARADKDLAKLLEQEPDIRNRLSGTRQKADEAKASLSSTQNQGNVLNGLMRLQDSGRIEGFHGRLGNLGTIDPKYDVAISTACPSLENLVVDTVETGQQCIDYLRKNNLGRANIILLDRLAKRDLSRVDTPENAPRLFDLVKAKTDKFRPAFFSVLQNTLVADDLEQANRIAYGARRWRVVTLDGQLIDVSGTMSGGGNRVAKGAMSSKLAATTSKEQVSKLEVDREQAEGEFEEHQQKFQEAENKSISLRDQIPKLEMDIQKASLEIESIRKNQADTEQRIIELQKEEHNSGIDENQMLKLEKQIVALEREIEKLRSETAGLEGEIQSLQDKIMEVGGVKLRAQKAKVDGLKEQIDLLTEEMSNAEIAISKAQKQVAKQEKAFEEAERELASAEQDLVGLDSEAQDQAGNAASSKQRAEAAQDELSAKKDELSLLKKELDDKTAELNDTRAVEIDMRNKLEENQKIQSENQKRLKYWNEKLSKLAIQSTSDLGEAEEAPEELPQYTRDEMIDMNKDVLKAEIATLEERLQNVNVELGVLAEYRRRVEEHASRNSDLQTAVASRDSAKKRCDELRKLRLEGFMTGFSMISLRLKEMYQMITMGGNAELELVDSLDPFSEGILFSVMPPKKSWKNISNLSGGEKTLSSLALVFALHHYKPTPLYVMDEIDAALDFRNVSIVASYIKERTKNAQFIVISLRNNMFELASRLVGVYKVNHMTKSVTVENRDYIARR